MGNSLTPEMCGALVKELHGIKKEAFVGGMGRALTGQLGRAAGGTGRFAVGRGKALQEAAHRMVHPVEGLKKGLAELSPAKSMAKMTEKERTKFLKPGFFGKPGEHLKGRVGLRQEKIMGKGGILGGGAKSTQESGRIKALAEELSRRGWTGKGGVTKYTPLGMKGQTLAFMGMGAPGIARAAKREPTPTGEGGLVETGLGEGLGAGAFLASGTLGLLPGMAMYYGASKAGRGLGRIIDRLRGGADVGTAISAPSPEKARAQLTNIQRYYG